MSTTTAKDAEGAEDVSGLSGAKAARGARGMPWAVLRLHRSALIVWGASVVFGTVVLVWMYAISDDAQLGVHVCDAGGDGPLPHCTDLEDTSADNYYSGLLNLAGSALSWLPMVVAAWAGAALIGRELENGTAQLAWTQSVTPARWLAAKLTVPALLLTTGTAFLILLNVWARADSAPHLVGPWHHSEVYPSIGTTGIAYVLCALAIGALSGMLLRRALPSLGLAFGVMLVVHTVLNFLREDLWPVVTWTGNNGTMTDSGTAMIVESGVILTSGERGDLWDCAEGPRTFEECRSAVAGYYTDYHPASHFWPLQLVETGIVLALTALAAATAFWLLRRRTP